MVGVGGTGREVCGDWEPNFGGGCGRYGGGEVDGSAGEDLGGTGRESFGDGLVSATPVRGGVVQGNEGEEIMGEVKLAVISGKKDSHFSMIAA